ncbi:SDR family NAD(P)-dependent oxidoreductase [Halobacillus litoralis]|uniref:SDR family NAD(P)-dependent oxidoreductase n=1 Tax=Halobacillus litoralis TaxID=45668 RepID=UPI00136B9E6C|nr:SDR family oxidoreductase [Halobacillus litoralis]MYL39530.1 SDR family NAD(P)-dependent oxidoreductase [Halobacillus litoralis]
MDLQLKDKLILVTGSTQGIGKEIAKTFLEEGARVVINGRTAEKLDHVVEEFKHLGDIQGIAADVSTKEGADALIQKVDAIGDLDVLVNNTAMFEVKDVEDVTDEEWMGYFETNIMSAVRLSRHFLPKMLERDTGRILNISSEAGVKPLAEMIPYSTTKGAVNSLTRGLAERTKGTSVTVNAVLPGPTWTEGVAGFMQGAAENAGEELESFTKDYFNNNEPTSLIQRFGTVEEVAGIVVYLASPKASAINGAMQKVEGGIIRSV